MNVFKKIAIWIFEPHGNEGYIEAQNRVLALICILFFTIFLGMVSVFNLTGDGILLHAIIKGLAVYTLCAITFIIFCTAGLFLYRIYVFIRWSKLDYQARGKENDQNSK